MTRALITGITGQDGSYLSELLLAKGYTVAGLIDQREKDPPSGVELSDSVQTFVGNLLDSASLDTAITAFQPNEIYNLAAMSFVGDSWDFATESCDVTGLGVVRLLEAVRRLDPTIRFFQASSSEQFGDPVESPQSERTPFAPRSPYGVAKAFGHNMVSVYRQTHGIFAATGILFNHESPRRGLRFVTRKITHGVARIKFGLDQTLELGNLDVARDWGFAGDYVDAMHRILRHEAAGDYVIASGETHQLREFLEIAFSRAGLEWQDHVVTNAAFVRPNDVSQSQGDISKARAELGWQPRTTFTQLVEMMVDADLERVQRALRAASG